MPHEDGVEEEKLGKSYDARLFGRLMRYIRPYGWFVGLATLLLLISAGFDVVQPLLVKTAVDRFMVPAYSLLEQPPEWAVERYGADFLNTDGGFLVQTIKLRAGDKVRLEKGGVLSWERYSLISLDERTRPVVESHPAVFLSVDGERAALVQSRAKLLTRQEAATVRGDDLRGLGLLALLFFGAIVLSFLAGFGNVYTLQYVGQKIMYDLRMELARHIIRLPMSFYDRTPVGRVVTRATNDVEAINEMFTSVAVNLLKDAAMMALILGMMVWMSLKLTLLVAILIPLLAVSAYIFRKYAREAYRKVRWRLSQINAFVAESISGVKLIQLFTAEGSFRKRFGALNQRLYSAQMQQLYTFGVFRPIMDIFNAFAVALILWYGGGSIVRGTVSFGALVAFISYVEMLFSPIRDLSEKYNIMQSAFAASERIFKLLAGTKEPEGGSRTLSSVRGDVEFREVKFAYTEGEMVLRGVSFAVPAGSTLAIVGATGAGKTSIISVLLRFYEIQGGSITLDNVDIRELNSDFLRRQMALVQQDVFIFADTVAGNVALKEEPKEEIVKEAVRYVGADAMVSRLKGGLDAEVRERGAGLSSGERQLLAFARALYFNPKVLILDEATANIDSESELLIQESLQKLLQGRTAIVIAHRLSTIRNADNILVMKEGMVVEQGNHEQLMARRSHYYYLYTLQAEAA